jgi:hypothetical protein
MSQDTFDLLARIVAETKCKPGWSFRLVDEEGAKRLVITLTTNDNYDGDADVDSPDYRISHYHPVPIATYNEATWRRWIFEQCLRTMNHELGESLRFGPDEVRPFVPMHGPGEDPYTVHEWRSEEDARTDQRGKRRTGPV